MLLAASSLYKYGPSLTSACGPACGWTSLRLRHAGTVIILDAVRFVWRDTMQASGEAQATWMLVPKISSQPERFQANPGCGSQQGWRRSQLNRDGIIFDHLWRASTSSSALMCFVASNFASSRVFHFRRSMPFLLEVIPVRPRKAS